MKMPTKIAAGARNPIAARFQRGAGARAGMLGRSASTTGGATAGTIVLTAQSTRYLPKAAAASFSSWAQAASMAVGFFSHACRSAHSPEPLVDPNAAGAWSDMSKTKVWALARAEAVALGRGSG